MTYDLTRLGSNRFEHLAQALTIGALGHGVDIFGAGPDGGREATFRGEVHMEGKGPWNGYGVVQAKFKQNLTGTAADQAWFFNEITKELDAWIDPKKKRHLNKPDYLVLVTNVPLTSVAESGGLDRLDRLFARYRDLTEQRGDRPARKIGMPEFKDYAVWHSDYLDRLLENNSDVREAYADLILPGDLISRLHEQLTEADRRLAHAWIGHVARAIRNDISVELGESGDDTNSPLSLADVAVDLPATFNQFENASPALQLLTDRSDQVLSPALLPASRDRVIVLGGPGSGKSTLSRLLCQLYRVSLIREAAGGRVTQQVAQQAERIREAFDLAGLPRPTLHRLPVRVVLSAFADAVSRSRSLTMLQHIIDLINKRASDPITVQDAKRLLAAWPLLVVLDGMDEVASPENRTDVSNRISDFLTEMAALQADVFTVCTSRPIGFEHDPELDYEELRLTPLSATESLHYASRLLACRFAGSHDRQEQTLDRLSRALRTPETARLMASPLQTTILSLILEQRRQAPASRYALFKSYYDTIYARECNKPAGFGDVLEAYRPQFDQLHDRCGLAVHAAAERAGSSESILPLDEFESIARSILEAEGHGETDSAELIRQMMRLAQQRLVLLVPKMDGVAFEVRSLAEFFAARCLMSGGDAADKLELLVPSAHWRHTWLLAAGYIFSERLYLRDSVVGRLVAADHSSPVNRLVMPGALLAVDALEDGFAANTPKFERDLVTTALRMVVGPIGSHVRRLAHALASLMEKSNHVEQTVWLEVEALMADRSAGATRAFLTGLATSNCDAITVKATNKLVQHVEMRATSVGAQSDDDQDSAAMTRAKLVDEGLLSADDTDPNVLERIAQTSTVGDDADSALIAAREIIVAGCRDNYDLRAKIRGCLSEAIAHDQIGHALQLGE